MGLNFTDSGGHTGEIKIATSTDDIIGFKDDLNTIVSWFDPASVSNSAQFLWGNRAIGTSFYLNIETGGVCVYQRARGGTAHTLVTSNSGVAVASQWNFLGCVDHGDGNVGDIYWGDQDTAVSDVKDISNTPNGTVDGSTEDAVLMNRGLTRSNGTGGSMGLWIAYNIAMTISEIEILRTNPFYRREDAMAFYMPGLLGVGSAEDWSGKGHDGIVAGNVALSNNPRFVRGFPSIASARGKATAAAVPLDNLLIGTMHYGQPGDSIAMGF